MYNPDTNKPAPVHVTGMGLVSSAGIGVESLWRAVLDERSTLHDGFGRVDPTALKESIRERPWPYRSAMEALLAGDGRNAFLLMTMHALAQAMSNAGWTELRPDDGVIFATTTGHILAWEQDVIAWGGGQEGHQLAAALHHEPLGLCLDVLRRLTHARGPMRLLSSACASSTQAIALGTEWIRRGKVRRCLVGGGDVLCRLTIEGFRCLQLLSSRQATPFDVTRSGINLSEGAAFLCLEGADAARSHAGVVGVGWSSDAYHLTSPHPEGRGSYEAMRDALAEAGVEPAAVNWIHAHGTGSQANDLAESTAIAALFGRNADDQPWVSSTKAIHGHALGAAGAIETVLCVMAMREGIVVPTHGLQSPDPRVVLRHPPGPLRGKLRYVLKNSLGFGGANAALLLGEAEARP